MRDSDGTLAPPIAAHRLLGDGTTGAAAIRRRDRLVVRPGDGLPTAAVVPAGPGQSDSSSRSRRPDAPLGTLPRDTTASSRSTFPGDAMDPYSLSLSGRAGRHVAPPNSPNSLAAAKRRPSAYVG